MKTPFLPPTRSPSARAANTLLGVAFAAGLAAFTIAPAVADDNDSRDHAQRQDQHQQSHRKARPEHRYESRRDANPAYVYAPPPVVYDPRPSPGVSLFFNL
jgi:hypothetical protein